LVQASRGNFKRQSCNCSGVHDPYRNLPEGIDNKYERRRYRVRSDRVVGPVSTEA